METPRKARFAILESSLLARKGQARPAIPPGNDHDEAVTRADLIAEAEAHHTPDIEHHLTELIIRPTRHNESAAAAIHGHPTADPEPALVPTNDHFYEPEPAPRPVQFAPLPEIKVTDHQGGRPARRRVTAAVEPRGLDREQAAQYVGLSRSMFARLVDEDILPDALPFGRRRVWDRRALDKALDQLSGIDRDADKPGP